MRDDEDIQHYTPRNVIKNGVNLGTILLYNGSYYDDNIDTLHDGYRTEQEAIKACYKRNKKEYLKLKKAFEK